MKALEEAMKKHIINVVSSSSNSSSHEYGFFSFGFSFNATYTSCFDEWLIDSGTSYHMAKDKTYFLL
jgi:hypothetical protein